MPLTRWLRSTSMVSIHAVSVMPRGRLVPIGLQCRHNRQPTD